MYNPDKMVGLKQMYRIPVQKNAALRSRLPLAYMLPWLQRHRADCIRSARMHVCFSRRPAGSSPSAETPDKTEGDEKMAVCCIIAGILAGILIGICCCLLLKGGDDEYGKVIDDEAQEKWLGAWTKKKKKRQKKIDL